MLCAVEGDGKVYAGCGLGSNSLRIASDNGLSCIGQQRTHGSNVCSTDRLLCEVEILANDRDHGCGSERQEESHEEASPAR